ncbi:hypothetical protein ZIOFF_047597 [Zingiber officinale]|uniref:peptidylprolyl isomerase n=1 Tax=Zingiber officinale TaxID=94328 RepID=A0A8J5KQL9_ZINOF|nr:hypothetical protein ZIOFF_047597 [Zingiber officinale]
MAHALSSALPVLRSSCSTSMAASSSALLLPSGPCLFKRLWCNLHIKPPKVHCLDLDLGQRIRMEMNEDITLSRRSAIGSMFALTTFGLISANSYGAGLPGEEKPRLCDDECEKELENVPMVTTESGLQYKDIKIGEGPSPPIGFQKRMFSQICFLMGSESLPFFCSSSLEKGIPYIFRVGAGQVIKGLDEGILGMKVGGKRRLYIPGPLAFPKGLNSAPGRPRVAPSSPVIFDVILEYVPGLDNE